MDQLKNIQFLMTWQKDGEDAKVPVSANSVEARANEELVTLHDMITNLFPFVILL